MTVATIRNVRSFQPVRIAPALLLVFALILGVFTGYNPLLGIALAAALVFALIVVWDLALGVCLFLLVTFLDTVSGNQDLSLTKGAGAVLAASWLALMVVRRKSQPTLMAQSPRLTQLLVAFLAWSAISTVWAESSGSALRSTFRFALDILLIPIVFWAVRERRHVVWIFGVFIVGTLLSVGYGLAMGKVAAGLAAVQQVGRLSGANVEANVLATLLLVAIVFASALAVALKRHPVIRVLAVLAVFAGLAAYLATFSRGGVVAGVVVILAGCLYARRRRALFIAVAIIPLLVGVAYVESSSSGVAQRLLSTSSDGRTDIWKIGLRMAETHPVLGVGSGNYMVVEPHYLLASPGPIRVVKFIVDTPYPAHNIYLHVVAELGVVGLVLFLAALGVCLTTAMRAVRIFHRAGDRKMEVLGRALVLALIGVLVSDFFASEQYSKQLWLLLGLCPALLALAQRLPALPARASRVRDAPSVWPAR